MNDFKKDTIARAFQVFPKFFIVDSQITFPHLLPPLFDLLVIPRKQNLRHFHAKPFFRSGVLRILAGTK